MSDNSKQAFISSQIAMHVEAAIRMEPSDAAVYLDTGFLPSTAAAIAIAIYQRIAASKSNSDQDWLAEFIGALQDEQARAA